VSLVREERFTAAGAYVVLSLVLGIGASALGHAIGRSIGRAAGA
jgi:fluoride ion exporter CrcB/FEX